MMHQFSLRREANLGVNNKDAQIRSNLINILSAVCNSFCMLQDELNDQIEWNMKQIVNTIAALIDDPHHIVRSVSLQVISLD